MRDVVDALLDIRGLSLLADAPGIRLRCESLMIPPAQASLDTTFFYITGIYEWPEPATYVPIDWRCPDALA
ncbi:MAG: hypothetical protein WAP03_27845 [Methylorubrum rhodinum]|uniref:hypothetical protein n=1 Tax=Methylorubrum rhodinum TaxID=29428 RepID=UPI003BB1D3E0